MLLKGYTEQVLRVESNPNAQSLYWLAEIEDDVGAALPCLEGMFEDAVCADKIPFLNLKVGGRKVTAHPRKVVIKALKDGEETHGILKRIQRAVDKTRGKRGNTKKDPHVTSMPDPFEIFSILPQSNCRVCGQANSMTFPTLAAEGTKAPDDCPKISDETGERLKSYLALLE